MRHLIRGPRSAFGRNVLTLAGGTVLAQAIAVAASPVLTRLFAPGVFGEFAVYLSFVTIGAVAISGRYELAILLPREDEEARDLLVAALGLAVVLSVASLAVLAVAGGSIARLMRVPAMARWAYAVPLGMLLTASYQSLSYWINRKARYRELVTSRVMQSATMFGAQGGGGAVHAGTASLVGGHLAGQVVAIAAAMRDAVRQDGALLRQASWEGVRRVALLHRRFPLFIAPGHLANATSSQMPTILLGSLFGAATAGLYALAERVLVLPSALIGNSIGEVYRQEAAEIYQREGNCRALFLKTARRLAMIGFGPCAVVFVAGPWLFAFVFGEEWRAAGELARILAAMVFFQIVSSPLSQTVLLADMHRLELVWQIARVAVSAGAIVAGYAVFDDYRVGIALYAGGFAVLHAVHSGMQLWAASGRARMAPRS